MSGKFELFMHYHGNGYTVYNKVVIENGDYKKIAYISECGNIKLYIKESYIPSQDMATIKKIAKNKRKSFKEWFENFSDTEQYKIILDSIHGIPIYNSKFMEFIKDKRLLTEKLPEMREYYYSIA